RRLLHKALLSLSAEQRLNLFPAPGLGRWTRRLGLGCSQAEKRTQWLIDNLAKPHAAGIAGMTRQACMEVNLESARACEFVCHHVERSEAHNTAGLMRRHIYRGFARATLLGDEADLANFLTFGFAELEFQVRPSRQDLVLHLFKVLMEIFLNLRIP